MVTLLITVTIEHSLGSNLNPSVKPGYRVGELLLATMNTILSTLGNCKNAKGDKLTSALRNSLGNKE